MRKTTYFYIAIVGAAAASLLASLPWTAVYSLSAVDVAGFASFVSLAILSESFGVNFGVGGNRAVKSSIAFVPLLGCAIVFPPAATIIAAAVVQAFVELILKERVLWRATFNISQWALGHGLAALAYTALGGDHTSSEIGVASFVVVPVVWFASNFLLVSGFVAIRQQRSFLKTIEQLIGPNGGNVLYDLLASPIALVAAILYKEMYVGGLLLIVLPLLLIRYSYYSKHQLQEANQDLLRVLIKTIETRDPYTSGHSVRVSTLARMIAEHIGLRALRIAQIEVAALLHDVGKIDVLYAPLIEKRAALDEGERAVIRTHATKGADLLRNLTSLSEDVIKGVRHHHERYDGRGYPDHLVGKAIPVASRIIMLCDAIDAMLSDRPYRNALTIEQARMELRRCAGTQFDPEIVRVVLTRNVLEYAAQLASSPASEQTEVSVASTG